jgi:MtaA/CmuA family methyltransferase
MNGPDRVLAMPITMMFAAARIGVPYGRYALDHRVLVEAQLRVAEEFGFDHVSAISETREAPDCGAAVQYFEDQPYAIDERQALLAAKSDLTRLRPPAPCEGRHMSDRLQAIKMLRRAVGEKKIVEGWVEGPCQAAADLRGINALMLDFHDDPEFVRDLFEFVLGVGLRFARAQVEAGAGLVGIGDPASSLAGPRIYEEFVWPFQQRLVDGIHAAGARVRLHICGNTRRILAGIARLGANIVDIDSMVPLAQARAAKGPEQVLAGGIDPVRVLLNGTPAEVRAALARCVEEAGPRYIAAGGCEIPRETRVENVRALARPPR